METIYARNTQPRRNGRRGTARRRGAVSLAARERRRLLQLGICLVLFLTVFLGRGIFPERVTALRGEVLSVLRADTDFRGAFASLGRAFADGAPVAETLGALWVDVFAGGPPVQESVWRGEELGPEYLTQRNFLASGPNAADILARSPAALPQKAAQPAKAPLPEVLPPQPKPVYTGPPLPEGATMDDVSLNLGETASPVVAALASGYGWREHPIDGGERFHSGVDLAAHYGTAIAAFAEGTVDYIGESPAYGQYLQLRHANGVTSFYAHCSKLCVQPGQRVTLGQKVAEVGNTGNVTGTHLHFELKQNGTFLNPTYYIETGR